MHKKTADELNILKCCIEDVISEYIRLRYVPYSRNDNDMEVDPDSVTRTAEKIVELYGQEFKNL